MTACDVFIAPAVDGAVVAGRVVAVTAVLILGRSSLVDAGVALEIGVVPTVSSLLFELLVICLEEEGRGRLPPVLKTEALVLRAVAELSPVPVGSGTT